MTEYIMSAGRAGLASIALKAPRLNWRIVVLLVLMALAAGSAELRTLVFSAIADAYLQVTVFVAGTLAVVYSFEHAFRFDLGRAMARARSWQAPIAAALGALPGCGGAIIVVTQYTRGHVSFGSVVAVLIATMGDAAFLLLAREPLTGLGIMLLGFVVGTLSGWLVDHLHGRDFMPADTGGEVGAGMRSCPTFHAGTDHRTPRELLETPLARLWIVLVMAGVPLGVLGAFQFDTDRLFGALATYQPTLVFGVLGGILCLTMWAFGRSASPLDTACPYERSTASNAMRIIRDTNFVTSWVVLGFLSYELVTYFAGSGIEGWLRVWAPLTPLMAVLVGFIPGCGPQIVVTSLYLTGAVPLSAQLGNAISNDGDALFPALALAPRAAVLATLYSAVPALLIGYGYYAMVETGFVSTLFAR